MDGPEWPRRSRRQGGGRNSLGWLQAVSASLCRGLVLTGALACAAPAARALPTPSWVSETATAGSLGLIVDGRAAPLFVAAEDWPSVRRAAGDVQADVERVSGDRPLLAAEIDTAPAGGSRPAAVIAGTLGHSALVDAIAASGKLDAASIRGRWEGFVIQLVDQPLPGIDRALVIAGSDARGTVYGLYELSQQIGVSPWHWWADVPVRRHARLYVDAGLRAVDAPTVQYRGIFLNDEEPALGSWVRERYGGFDHRFHARLFELILRLRGNFLWPAMWNGRYFADDPLNGQTAADYGIVIGTSHHEPMMRAHREWNSQRMGPWDYRRNARALQDFWAGGLRQSRGTERAITLGMRGDGDEPMSAENDIPLLERIVADQRRLIEAEPDAASAPQVWALYKEVQGYHEQGMRVPDDVTLLWSDDNWGHLRRLPTPEERGRRGGAGVYYHLDYVGGPRSYKWINTTPLPKLWEQLRLADQAGAHRLWIVNVGDLKPMEVPMEFFLGMAWRPGDWDADRLDGYLHTWATREFGPAHAAEIAALVARYAKYNGRRKPELLSPETYSLFSDREAETVVADYRALADRAEALAAQLPAEQRDAYFQLVLYPVQASAIVNELHHAAALNHLYARQGRVEANAMAARARGLFAADAALARRYNESLTGGKWKHFMDQVHLGYTGWNEPPLAAMPAVSEVQPRTVASMGVAVEHGSAAGDDGQLALRPLEALGPPALPLSGSRRIEVFNRSEQAFEFSASADVPWVDVVPARGRIVGQQALDVRVRWDQRPPGAREARITVQGAGRSVVVTLPVQVHPRAGVRGFVESGGVVSIEAEHFDRAVAPPQRQWLRIPDHGRTLSGVTTTPLDVALPPAPDMRLEYDVHLHRAGEVMLHTTLAPTQKLLPGDGLRFAVSFDDEPPQVVNLHADPSLAAWERSVSDAAVTLRTRHRLSRPGAHVLKFWALDPAVVLNKLVIDAGGLEPSYLGPPESRRLLP